MISSGFLRPRDGQASDSNGRALQVGSVLGKCLLTERLGQGGTGVVFRALHQTLNIPVAVKILRPQVLAKDPEVYHRFKAEACLLAQLNHPNLVRIWDFEDDPEFAFLTLEYVEGLTLAELIQQSGQVRFDRALGIVTQVAEGLRFALQHKIIHRDIKPANIMMTKESVAKIADLGLAVIVTETQRENGKRNELLGTPAYMAPEQSQSSSQVDHRADIYALGATLYHAITGAPPFLGNTKLQVMYRHISEEPVAPHVHVPDLPIPVSNVILRMLAKKPEQRYQNYDELLHALKELTQPTARPQPNSGTLNNSRLGRTPATIAQPSPLSGTISPANRIVAATPAQGNIPMAGESKTNPPTSGVPANPEVKAALLQGIEAAKNGQREIARERLRTVTLLDPRNELGWLWLAGVCDSPTQAIHCLERVLSLNPDNAKARKSLEFYQTRQAELRSQSATTVAQASAPPVSSTWDDLPLIKPKTAPVLLPPLEESSEDLLNTPPVSQLDTHSDISQLGVITIAIDPPREPQKQVVTPPATPASAKVVAPPTPPKRAKVAPFAWIIDSDMAIAKLQANTLTAAGYRVRWLATLAEAEAALTEELPDLILLEPALPAEDGYPFCQTLREQPATAHIPIIILTHRGGFMDKMRARAVQSHSFLTKPCEAGRLLTIARQLCPVD